MTTTYLTQLTAHQTNLKAAANAADNIIREGYLEPVAEHVPEILSILSPHNDWRSIVEFLGACVDYRVDLDHSPVVDALMELLKHDEAYVRIAATQALPRCTGTTYFRS